MQPQITWPENKRFAFTVFDDTDSSTVENTVPPVYDLLGECGLRTTKSCWPLRGDPAKGSFMGQTCEDADYLRWLLDLQSRGFEIAWHGASWHGVPCETTMLGLEQFAKSFGHCPYRRQPCLQRGVDLLGRQAAGRHLCYALQSGHAPPESRPLPRTRRGRPAILGRPLPAADQVSAQLCFPGDQYAQVLPLHALSRSAAALRQLLVRVVQRRQSRRIYAMYLRGESGPAGAGRRGLHHVCPFRQ